MKIILHHFFFHATVFEDSIIIQCSPFNITFTKEILGLIQVPGISNESQTRTLHGGREYMDGTVYTNNYIHPIEKEAWKVKG